MSASYWREWHVRITIYPIFAILFLLYYFCYLIFAILFELYYFGYTIFVILFLLSYFCYPILAILFLLSYFLSYFCYPILAILFRHVGSLAPKDFWNIWLSAYLMKITTDPRRAQLIFYLIRSYFNNSLTPFSICGNQSMRSYNLLHSYRS